MGQYSVGIETKKNILNIARKYFYELGYHETSLPFLAKEAGVKLGTLQYHYNNKRDLYEIIFLEDSEKNENLAISLTKDPDDFIQRFAIQTAIYYYRIYFDEKYRRFAALSMELLYKDNAEFMSNDLDFISVPSADIIEEKENLLNSITLTGLDYAISNYLINNSAHLSYEDIVMYLVKMLARMYNWDIKKAVVAGREAIKIVEDLDKDILITQI